MQCSKRSDRCVPAVPVLCMVGDGGFMFNSSELSTAVKYGINVTTVIFRNDAYGNVANDLETVFGGAYERMLLSSGTSLSSATMPALTTG